MFVQFSCTRKEDPIFYMDKLTSDCYQQTIIDLIALLEEVVWLQKN